LKSVVDLDRQISRPTLVKEFPHWKTGTHDHWESEFLQHEEKGENQETS
jgi:hypothetical protein